MSFLSFFKHKISLGIECNEDNIDDVNEYINTLDKSCRKLNLMPSLIKLSILFLAFFLFKGLLYFLSKDSIIDIIFAITFLSAILGILIYYYFISKKFSSAGLRPKELKILKNHINQNLYALIEDKKITINRKGLKDILINLKKSRKEYLKG